MPIHQYRHIGSRMCCAPLCRFCLGYGSAWLLLNGRVGRGEQTLTLRFLFPRSVHFVVPFLHPFFLKKYYSSQHFKNHLIINNSTAATVQQQMRQVKPTIRTAIVATSRYCTVRRVKRAPPYDAVRMRFGCCLQMRTDEKLRERPLGPLCESPIRTNGQTYRHAASSWLLTRTSPHYLLLLFFIAILNVNKRKLQTSKGKKKEGAE